MIKTKKRLLILVTGGIGLCLLIAASGYANGSDTQNTGTNTVSTATSSSIKANDTDTQDTITNTFSPLMTHAVILSIGQEYAMSKESFSKAFPLIGLSFQNRIRTPDDWLENGTKTCSCAFTLLGDFNLSSTVAQQEQATSATRKALDFNVGLLWELLRCTPKTRLGSHTVTLGLLFRGGGVNAEGVNNILGQSFIGLRLWTLTGKFSGAYIELGSGRSDNFHDKEGKRIKCKAFLPLYPAEANNKVFVSWFVDSDGHGKGEDEMKFTIGTLMEPSDVLKVFDFIKPK